MPLSIGIIFLGLIFAVLAALPLFYHISHIGVWLPLAAGIFFILFGILDGFVLRHTAWWVLPRRIFLIVIAVGLAGLLLLSAIQFFGFSRCHSAGENQTVIVLGCKVRGDRPSKMLRYRLDKAYEILTQSPNINCIVSGGQGADEEYPEAEVMKNYLVERGISPERVFKENQSKSTLQNLQYSKKILEREQLGTSVILVTDFYHQYRSNLYAKQEGLSSEGASCYTNPALVFSYWIRESMATVKAFAGL